MTIVALAGLAAGCVPPPEPPMPELEVVLSVSEREYEAGDTVTVTLENRAAEAVGYNLCASALERRSGGAWVAVPEERVCTMELRTLQPGQRASHTLQLPQGLAAGEYRYSTGVEVPLGGARTGVASAPFRVVAPR